MLLQRLREATDAATHFCMDVNLITNEDDASQPAGIGPVGDLK